MHVSKRQCGGSSSCVVSGMSAMGVSSWFELTMYNTFCFVTSGCALKLSLKRFCIYFLNNHTIAWCRKTVKIYTLQISL